jgi:gamma-glutamyltranspeptidase/glutathione hydrolase/leukotriene-C4 hydrolase
MKNFTSQEYIDEIFKKINDSTAFQQSYYNPSGQLTPNDHGTGHMSVIAPNGDCAALTSTINTL